MEDRGESAHDLKACVFLAHISPRHTLIPPRGYSIAGISGSCGPWLDGFALIITR